MLNLNNLRNLLSQIISPPSLRSVVLFTPEGQLVSFSSGPTTSKDEIRVVVGLSTEVWHETKEQRIGKVDSELGRLLVLPADAAEATREQNDPPALLIAINGNDTVSWSELERKARGLVRHLEAPVAELRTRLAAAPTSPIAVRQERIAR